MKLTDLSKLGRGPGRKTLTHVDLREIQDTIERDQSTATEPVNTHIVQYVNEFKKDLPAFLKKQLHDETKFLLKEVFPRAFAHLNAYADANEVLVSTLGETASVAALAPEVEGMVLQAVRSKLLMRMISAFSLTEAETRVFLLRTLFQEGRSNESLQTLLHEVQSLVDMHRAPEGAKLQVQQLPSPQGGRKRGRVRVPKDGNADALRDVEIYEKLQAARQARRPRQQESQKAAQGNRPRSNGRGRT